MSLSRLFSKDSKSSSESSTRSKMNRGREVLKGRLWMRKAKTSKRQLGDVLVFSATHDGKQPGQIEIHEEVLKVYQKPKKVIILTDIAAPGVQGGPACTSSSLSCSPAAQSPRNSSLMGTSPSSSQLVLWPFQIVTKTGEVFEFFTESMEDQRQWLKRLGLLIMFPYSPIPEEPVQNPIKPQFKAKLNPKDYNADSVWAVYILPEEVGSRVHLLGINILSLKSGTEGHPGQLEIISPVDPTPIVTWDRDKMRRTGCLGNMVFIEIGRRCRGGPGLIWMYAGPEETAALRETLHMFLFKGDGRAVPISAQPHNRDSPRASFDSGFPSSYSKRGSQASLQRSPSINTPQRQVSFDSQPGSDSGHPTSPFNSSQPPPVDMGSHPSRHKPGRSAPRNISGSSQYENTSVDSGVTSQRSSSCRDSLASVPDSFCDDSQFDLDTEKSSPSPNDSLLDDRFPAGSLEPDNAPSSRHYSIPSVPPKVLHRSHSTATCHPSARSDEYERMLHPRHHMNKEGYVFMQPASGPESAMQQLRSMSDSPSRTSPPRPLRTISENKDERQEDEEDSIYENFPLNRDIENETYTYYMATYENIENVRQELSRQSLVDEIQPIHRSNSHSAHKETVVLGEKLKSFSPPHRQNVRTVQPSKYSPPVVL